MPSLNARGGHFPYRAIQVGAAGKTPTFPCRSLGKAPIFLCAGLPKTPGFGNHKSRSLRPPYCSIWQGRQSEDSPGPSGSRFTASLISMIADLYKFKTEEKGKNSSMSLEPYCQCQLPKTPSKCFGFSSHWVCILYPQWSLPTLNFGECPPRGWD